MQDCMAPPYHPYSFFIGRMYDAGHVPSAIPQGRQRACCLYGAALVKGPRQRQMLMAIQACAPSWMLGRQNYFVAGGFAGDGSEWALVCCIR